MTIKFTNLGRSKLTFERVITAMTHEQVERAMRTAPGPGIMSRDVEFVCRDSSGLRGDVVVGGFRCVGQWEVSE